MNTSFDYPHRRYNPLTNTWVLVSAHRTKRPWLGAQEQPTILDISSYDEKCYLCPTNQRMGGDVNPDYQNVYVFPNDFMALLPDTETCQSVDDDLFTFESVKGECRVICFSPDHSKTLPLLSVSEITTIVNVWQQQSIELGAKYKWIQIFENKGQAMGCSNPHPHGQIWASDFLPNEIAREDSSQRKYYEKHKSPMLLDYVERELAMNERVIVNTKYWVVVVPYWAVWPFETLLLPKFTAQRLTDLNTEQSEDLALAIKRLTTRYDNLFQTPFPYSMGFHFAPYTDDDTTQAHWQLHAHFYPPLLRSATVKKFMVGYELLAEVQRDLTAEQAANRLNEVSDTIHYSMK